MIKKRFFKKGFSLVELLVVVSIILILVGIGTYSINRFTQLNKVSEVRDYILTRVKLARTLSVTNQLPDQSLGLSYVKVLVSGTKIIVEGIDGVGVGTTETPYFSEELDMPESTTITVTNNSSAVNSFGFSGTSGRLICIV